MKFLAKEALNKLTTPRLLAYKNALLKVPDCEIGECDCGKQGTKSEPIWNETYANVKEILSTREHVHR